MGIFSEAAEEREWELQKQIYSFLKDLEASQAECKGLEKRVRELEAEKYALLEEAFMEGAEYESNGEMSGWWDTCARSAAKVNGDRLVKTCKWERHPDGIGRRWFYRPVPTPPTQDPKKGG